jgi:type 1 fimbria pilin
MFKKTLFVLTLTAVTGATVAAPVANLKISGDIKPPTCTVNGGEQADLIYNLGTVSPSVIPQSAGYNGLPSISNMLTVTCDAATYLTFKAMDTYQNPFIPGEGMNIKFAEHAFNLVDANATDKTVGGITYIWSNVSADGVTAYLSRANDGSNDNGNWAGGQWIIKDATNGWTKTQQKYVNPSELDLISAREFTAQITNALGVSYGWANSYLLSKDELVKQGVDISEGVDYIGNVLLTFKFGV